VGELAEELKRLIDKRVEDRGIVVWYDPEGIYAGVFEELEGEGLQKFRYDGSFFALRREADSLLEGSARPKAVIYVPLGRDAAGFALVELESAGDVVYPGATTGRNTKLEVITRSVLKQHLPEAKVEAVCRQIAERKLTLEEIESVIEEAKRVVPETLKLILGTSDPSELALLFVSDRGYDANIVEKNATPELAALLASDFGLELAEGATPQEMRKELRRSTLLGELISNLQVEVPQRLSAYVPREDRATRNALLKLAEKWRKRSDLKESYEEAADETEREYDIAAIKASELGKGVPITFRATAVNVLREAEDLILAGKPEEAREKAQSLLAEFWYEADPRVALKCNLLLHICALILKCAEVLKELKNTKLDTEEMVRRYAGGDNPWCELDRLQREAEQRYEKYDIDDGDDGGKLERVMAKARQAFSEAVGSMAEKYQEVLARGGFSCGQALLQRELFKEVAEPLRESGGKLAFMCVDALRYEMASELARELEKRHEVGLSYALATLPSVTGVGMAALLPGAERSISLAVGTGGALGLDVNGKAVISREDRVSYLAEKLGGKTIALALEDLQKLRKKTKDALQEADFAYVTSQEIDSICEMGNDSLARDVMGELVARLRRAIKSLVSCGFDKIVITADHGYLFGEEVESGMKIDPPGGKTAVLKQRVWLGEGGAAGDAFIRVKEMDLGMDGGYELAFPRGVASFKVKGGGKSYFHGGISLQEMVIPVLTLRAGEEPAAKRGKKPAIALSMDRKKVGRYFRVKVEWTGQRPLMEEEKEEELRLSAVLKIAGEERGKAIAASYGFDESSGEFTIKESEENTITIIVDEGVTGEHTGSIHVVNSETKAEVAVMEDITIDITF